jgi:hypothetical protein
MINSFDCEILPTNDTLRRGIAGFKAKIVERRESEVIVKVWDDFKSTWSEPQRVKPEEIQEL